MSEPRTSLPQPALAANMRARPRFEFLRRLGVYLIGVALGLVMLGAIYSAKRFAVASQPTQPNQPPTPAQMMERALRTPARPNPTPQPQP